MWFLPKQKEGERRKCDRAAENISALRFLPDKIDFFFSPVLPKCSSVCDLISINVPPVFSSRRGGGGFLILILIL